MGHMRRLTWLIPCLVLAGVAAAADPAAAAPRALLDVKRAEDVAVSGGAVLVAATTARGGARLIAAPAAGGPAHTVFGVAPPGRRGWTSTTRLAASGQLAALLVEFTDPEGDAREWRVYAGPPAGPFAVVQRTLLRRPSRFWFPFDLDVHGDRLLVQEVRVPRPFFRLTVHAPGMPPARLPQGPFGAPAALAGDQVAYHGVTGRADARPLIRVVDWRTGRPAGSIELRRHSGDIEERHLDLADGGRAVAALDGGLYAGAPGERAHRLRGSARMAGLSTPRFAGARVAALAEARHHSYRPVLIDPRTGSRHSLGPRSTALTSIAADETTVAWLANGCVLTADTVDVAPLKAVPAGPCPRAEAVLDDHDRRLRGRSLRVRVTCVAAPRTGCRGVAVLGFDGRAGRGRFRVVAGRSRLVRVRLTRRGMAALRRQHAYDPEAQLRLDARLTDGRVSLEAAPRFVFVRPPA